MAPLISTRGGITVKAYGLTNGAAADFRAFFITTGNPTNFVWNADSTGNLYAGGNIPGVSSNLIKINGVAGVLSWQKQDTTNTAFASVRQTVVENSTGLVTLGNAPSGTGFHYLLNSSGVIQYQRRMNGGANGKGLESYPKGLDTSGNLHGGIASSGAQFYVSKFSSTGTLTWQRQLTRSGVDVYFYGGTTIDSSGAVYSAFTGLDNSSGNWHPTFSKYNSSGTIQWMQTNWATGMRAREISSQLTGNPAAVMDVVNSNSRWITVSFNASTGAIVFARELTGPSIVSRAVATDTSGNVYSVGIVGATEIYIAKYNSSGALQWQRRVTSSGTLRTDETKIIVADTLNYYLSFNSPTGSYCLKLPQDGTLTGSYVIGGQTITYATTTALTDAAYSGSWNANLYTDASGAQGFITSTNTLTDSTLTLSRI